MRDGVQGTTRGLFALAWLMAVSAVLALANGLLLMFFPETALASHGVHHAGEAAFALARVLGATLVGFGVINWCARKSQPSLALWSIVLGDATADSLSFAVALVEQMQGSAVDVSGWLTVLLYLAFAAGFWFFLFTVKLR